MITLEDIQQKEQEYIKNALLLTLKQDCHPIMTDEVIRYYKEYLEQKVNNEISLGIELNMMIKAGILSNYDYLSTLRGIGDLVERRNIGAIISNLEFRLGVAQGKPVTQEIIEHQAKILINSLAVERGYKLASILLLRLFGIDLSEEDYKRLDMSLRIEHVEETADYIEEHDPDLARKMRTALYLFVEYPFDVPYLVDIIEDEKKRKHEIVITKELIEYYQENQTFENMIQDIEQNFYDVLEMWFKENLEVW